MAVGDIAIVRQSTSGGAVTTSATPTKFSFNTTDRNDASWTISTGTVTLPAGRYILGYNIGLNCTTTRMTVKSQIYVDGAALTGVYGQGSGYFRNTSGFDEDILSSTTILDIGSSSDVEIRLSQYDTIASTSATVLNTNSSMWIMEIDDTWDYFYGRTNATDVTATNSLNFDGTISDVYIYDYIRWAVEDEKDTGSFTHSTSSETPIINLVKGKYLAFYSAEYIDTLRNICLTGYTLGGTHYWDHGVDSAYPRTSGASYATGSGCIFIDIDQDTDFRLWFLNVGELLNSATMNEAAITIVRLPDSVDYIKRRRTTKIDITSGADVEIGYDTSDKDTSGLNLSYSANTFAVSSNTDLYVIPGATYIRDSNTDARREDGLKLSIDGTQIAHTGKTNYNRGEQSGSGDGTFFSAVSCAWPAALDNGEDLTIDTYTIGPSTSDVGLEISADGNGITVIDWANLFVDRPIITDVETTNIFDDKQTGVTITGSNFEATQGTGTVEISDNYVYGSGTVVEQTVTSWGTTSIDFTAVLGAMNPGTPRYLWVTNNSGERNPFGWEVHVHRAQAITLSASSNISASGENTTEQLTPPSGKTTVTNFGGGRIQDDENPGDDITLSLSDFREDEWAFEFNSEAEIGEVYQFRVTVDGVTELQTYTVDPRLTVKSGFLPFIVIIE